MKSNNLWRNHNFLLLWIGGIVSGFGFQFYLVTLPLFIYFLTESPLAMSTMRAIEFVPNILLGMLAGVLVDRFNRKKVMIVTQLIQVLSLLLLVYLVSSEQIVLWQLYMFGFILTSMGYTFGNARHSIIPQLVGKEQLVSVNARFTFVGTLIDLIGPGIAGIMLTFYSFKENFMIYTVSQILLLCALFFLSKTEDPLPTTQDKRSIWGDMKEGLVELWGNKLLLTPTLVILFINLSSSLTVGVTMFFAVDLLEASEREVGFMLSIAAIGGLFGSLIVTPLRKFFTRGQIFIYSIFVSTLGLLILTFSFNWWMVGLSMAVRTCAVVLCNVVYSSFRQEFTPNHLLGRIAGTTSMLMKLTLPFGLLLSGIWAESNSVRFLFAASTLITFLLLIVFRNSPIKTVK